MLAISEKDYLLYGCPNCGCDTATQGSIYSLMSQFATCQNCKLQFMILANNNQKSDIGITNNNETEYPVLIQHPRVGSPRWHYIWPDPRPEGGGEYFTPRGVGYDLAGFVKSKQAGERIINMVKDVLDIDNPKTWLDYRPHEPLWIQVKFDESEFNLMKLDFMTTNTGIITKEILEECKL